MYYDAFSARQRLAKEQAKRPSGATDCSTVLVTARDPQAVELLTRAVKWLDRLHNRRDMVSPAFWDNYTDPEPLLRDVRKYLSNAEVSDR